MGDCHLQLLNSKNNGHIVTEKNSQQVTPKKDEHAGMEGGSVENDMVPTSLANEGTTIKTNGISALRIVNGSVSNGKANGSISTGKVNGSVANGNLNGTFSNGKANGSISNGKANGSISNGGAVNGSVLNGKANGTVSNGKANETISNGQVNGTSNSKANGSVHHEMNGSIVPENTNGLLNGHSTDAISKADDVIKNGLVDIYKNGVVEGLEVPHGDVRKTIRSNMFGVQPNFKQYEWDIKWGHVFMIGFVHVWALLAIPSLPHVKWQTLLLRLFEGAIAGVGVTAGAHRLYCHRAYKATLPLHLFLLWAYSVAGQNTLFDWVRDHRVHHKFSETDADPHNANRGWFFSHCGWLMIRKHPEVLRRGKTVDMSDITGDPYIAIHSKIFYVLKSLTCHIIPILIPMMLWEETFWVAANSMIFRFAFTLNATWSVNSFAHLWGERPIDKRIFPGENWLVALLSFGEGWHNYHHVFPWDYKAAEWGPGIFNMATIFLDLCAWSGLAYDLKQPSPDLIRRTALRHGDGTWTSSHVLEEVPEPSVAKDHAKAC